MDFILADTTHQALISGLNLVMQKAKENPYLDHVVLLPDTKTLIAERYLLSICDSKAFANIYIYSLSRLLNKISPVASNLVLDKQSSIMIVRKIVLENQKDLVCYKKTALTNGFAEIMFGTISQLKSSNISVEEFYSMAENASPSLKIKMQDIARIYDQYEQYIENRYLDQSDLLNVLKESSINSEFVKNAEFYYLGFESITEEAMLVCKEIIKACKHFVVGAAYLTNQANGHIADNEIFNKFKSVADEFDYSYQPARVHTTYAKTFEHIKNNLYAYPPKVMLGTDSVEILQAPSKISEVEFVAQKISKLVDEGLKYNQIGIVCTNLEEYQEHICKIFDEYHFSYFVNKPYDYASHPLFNLIKSYLNIVRKNYEKTAIIEFLSNILLGQTDKIASFINYVEQYGIDHGDFKKPFERYDENILTGEEFAGLEQMRQALVFYVSLFDAKNAKVESYNNAIRQFLDKIDIDSKLENLQVLQETEKEYAAVTKQAKQKLDLVLSGLDKFLAQEEMSLEMYQNLLTSGLSASDISILPVSQDSIVISNVADELEGIEALFIIGATEGAFPIKQQDCGMILDDEIKQLGEISQKTIEPTIKTINRRERFKAYETLLLPKSKLYLSYHEGVGEDANKPSAIIDQLIYMFGSNDYLRVQKYSEYTLVQKEYLSKTNSLDKLEEYVCKEIGHKKAYGDFENSSFANSAYYAIKDKMTNNLANRIEKINTQEDYVINNADKIFFTNGKTSVSQLEKYFTCPFLFFANYGLRLRENPTSTMQAMDVGNILHKVAELFLKKYAKNNQIDIQKTAKSIITGIISQEYVTNKNKFLVKIIEEESIRLCERLAEEQQHSHFKPAAFEESFGEGKKLPAVELSNKIKLEGKIDRIDTHDGKFRIIDYKTGKIEDNIKRVFYGKKIQLISYLMAMEQMGLKPAGVVYFPIRNEFSDDTNKKSKMKGFFLKDTNVIKSMDTTLTQENLKGTYIDVTLNTPDKDTGESLVKQTTSILTEKEFDVIRDYCKQLASGAVDEILSGYIMPSPIKLTDSESTYCKNCPYSGVCGVQKTKYAGGRKCYTAIKIEDISKIGGEE